MDLLGMEIFTHVVEARSFSGAARRLGLSKSVVSKHITQVERSLGVRLLNRTTRSISLTETGAVFYEHCARMIAAAEEAEASAASLNSEPRGMLKVQVPVTFGVLHIAPALKDLLAKCPELSIDMKFSEENPNLVEDGCDAAIVIVKEPSPRLVARKLAPNRRCVCATADYFRRHGVPQTPGDLAQHNCIIYSLSGSEREWSFLGPEGEMWVEVHGILRCNNENAIRQAALAGVGLALLPSYIIGQDLQRGTLAAVLPDFAASDSAVYAVYASNRHVAAKVRAFVDFLVERFSPTPYWDVVIEGDSQAPKD